MPDHDAHVRLQAFRFLEEQCRIYGETLPRRVLEEGFIYEDVRVPMIGPQGIFKPAILPEIPLTFTTVPIVEGQSRPYEDELGNDGLIRYRTETCLNAARDKAPPDDSRLLNVVVLETQFARDDAQQILVHVPPEFPVLLSRAVAYGRSVPLVPELPFIGGATLLDIFTFLAPERVGPNSKAQSRSNEVARLKYKVRFLRWEADQYEAEIQCDSQMRKRESFRVSARRDTTTILASGGPKQARRLVVALTPLQSVPIPKTGPVVSGASNITDPVPIATPAPQYPENLAQASAAGLVKLKTVIRRDGTIDGQNFCLLECPHYLFARNALSTVTREWKFKPAKKDGEPVDIITTIEIRFRLGR